MHARYRLTSEGQLTWIDPRMIEALTSNQERALRALEDATSGSGHEDASYDEVKEADAALRYPRRIYGLLTALQDLRRKGLVI